MSAALQELRRQRRNNPFKKFTDLNLKTSNKLPFELRGRIHGQTDTPFEG
jgi:hypothetical protein